MKKKSKIVTKSSQHFPFLVENIHELFPHLVVSVENNKLLAGAKFVISILIFLLRNFCPYFSDFCFSDS